MKKIFIILFVVLLLGTFLRFYKLGDIPTGFHRDEAFLGYNAYSIAKTGKDMSGNFLPIHLQSFIYSPAGYSYLSIPFISIFGLSPFSTRFASALSGTATILMTYLLARVLIKKVNIALFASFFLAISPWHVNLSRTATENTIAVFFISLGVWWYLRWRTWLNPIFLFLSCVAFSTTIAIYQAPRAYLPIFIPFMTVLLGVPKHRWTIVILLYVIAIILPIALILKSPQLSLRIQTVSIFATQETQLVLDEQIREDGISAIPQFMTRIFHNKIINYTDQFLKNYVSHFSYDFLFTDKGLPDRYRIPNSGLLYIFELPLIILGMYSLWKKSKRITLFLLGWILIVPIGSALTFDDVPNLQRTLLMFPALSMIVATGAMSLIRYRSSLLTVQKIIIIGKICFIFLGIFNISFYLHEYYVHQIVHRPWYRQEGYKTLVNTVQQILPEYEKVIITNRESAPTIFFLFFTRYDPRSFQTETFANVSRDVDKVNFAKLEFSEEECPLRLANNRFTGLPHTLYVNYGTCSTPTDLANNVAEVKRGDNSTVFKVVTTK